MSDIEEDYEFEEEELIEDDMVLSLYFSHHCINVNSDGKFLHKFTFWRNLKDNFISCYNKYYMKKYCGI